ncbi:hypothetical protein EMPS_05533 [Entomortierella parvispora]|uniref:Uncharacterized protein n=1 Tax=Entomortierella parvispora TaxID=205924 RepID=A0A9P3HAX0_9FUNG|nr:hypothetical protein EMPS_05533 [Entomortierella parvispora]
MRASFIILALSASVAVVQALPTGFDAETIPSPSQSSFSAPDLDFDLEGGSFEAFEAASPSSFLIELDVPPAGMNRHERIRLENSGDLHDVTESRRTTVAVQHENFQSYLSDNLKLEFSVRHEFFDLINGMSIDLRDIPPKKIPKILEKIRSTPGVVSVSPLITVNRPKTIVHEQDFDSFNVEHLLSSTHEKTGVLGVRDTLGFKGRNIRVGVIDTGVDYTHEAFGSCYGPGCKVAIGYDFVDENSKTPGGFDCVGHGTHVAGIIAGNCSASGFFGVAPEVVIGAYRVFPCSGNSKDDVIIAALERAYQDNMDIINMSLGGGSSWANTSLSRVAGMLSDLGVIVVAAVGNDGELGLDEISSPSINSKAISVASFEGAGYASSYFQVDGNNDTRIDYSDKPPKDYIEKAIDLVLPSHDEEGCSSYPNSVDGSVVLLKRGSCTFISKIKIAQDAGAVGCIFYNNVNGTLHPMVDEPSVKIFGHGITLAQGQLLLDQFKAAGSDSIKIVYRAKKGIFENELGGKISIFSSWGLGPELELKPDIGAPGGNIYSTIPVAKGSYTTMSGTSMATPYVAGAAALLLESEPTVDRASVLGRLQMYGKPGYLPDRQVLDSAARQGAGMINILNTVQGKAFISPSHLALNDSVHTEGIYNLTLTNHYATGEEFKLTHLPAISILGFRPSGQPSDKIQYDEAAADLVFGSPTVKLEPNETRTFTIRFNAPQTLDAASHWIYSGYIKIEPTLDTTRPALQVPYAGMHGSYSTVDILDMQSGYPVMLGPNPDGRLSPVNSASDSSKRVYTMRGKNIVTLVLKISNPVRSVRVYVLDTETKKIQGIVPMNGEYIGRTDSSKQKFFFVAWAGRMIDLDGNFVAVPDGSYSLIVVASKPFSDTAALSKEPHETWVSPTFTIEKDNQS